MQPKTYVAADIQTALQQIKAELGPDAVIISSRKLKARRGAFGLLSAGGVEITAALEAPPVPKLPTANTRRAAKTYAVVGGEEDEALALHEARRESRAESPPRRGKEDSVLFYMQPLRDEIRELSETIEVMKSERIKPESSVVEVSRLRSEISELKYLVGKLAHQGEQTSLSALPEPLRGMTMRLADAGVDMDIIRDGIKRLGLNLTPSQLADTGYVQECVIAELMKPITVAAPLDRADSRAQVVALVGPTGVGKTTTAAKIAGQLLRRNPNAKIALITLDTFRVGAFDQLRVYGDLMGITAKVAETATELDQIVRRHLDHDLVLIDTAGGNQKDTRLLDDLQKFISPNPLIETHLCLSATTKPRDLRDICERFMPLAIEKIIFTKIDETNSGGSLYNFLTQSGKPLAYLTHGQNVPDDIMTATKDRVCRWVMGEGVHAPA